MSCFFIKDHVEATVREEIEKICWGCGLRLLLPSNAPIFKCGWCGAVTNQRAQKRKDKSLWWRRWRDRCFVSVVSLFMLCILCGGVWAVHPVVFSISYISGIFHCLVTAVLAVSTFTTFGLAAFCCAGRPPNIQWGSYPVVGKGDLEDYTFCLYCCKPKSPRSHHCRSCGMCIEDMDHHCPFIGNCVGATNHRHFIIFLISTLISTVYVTIMCSYAGWHIWPPLRFTSLAHPYTLASGSTSRVVRELSHALLGSAMLLSTRGIILVYLIVSSVSVQIGLTILLWQQLCYIYEGETYLSHLSSGADGGSGGRDCQNLVRFFGCPYSFSRHLPIFRSSQKRHRK